MQNGKLVADGDMYIKGDDQILFSCVQQGCDTPINCRAHGVCSLAKLIKPNAEKQTEQVDHPAHYGGDTVYETIKVLEAWSTPDEFYGFLKLTIIKYQSRLGKKNVLNQDLKKAIWYSTFLSDWIKRTNYKLPVSTDSERVGGQEKPSFSGR